MKRQAAMWSSAVILGVGAFGTTGPELQRTLPLRTPLEQVIPSEIDDFQAQALELPEGIEQAVGVDDYLTREYVDEAGQWFSVYIGYYEHQKRGRTIHSPRNCLPGAGWSIISSEPVSLTTALGTVTVNSYLLQYEQQQALVLYWYQGRGRVQASEYLVKWDLLRDSALMRRSDEALVRIVVPITTDYDSALARATGAASQIVPALDRALPEG